eukprot:6312361-Prymnesium_polylepis.1
MATQRLGPAVEAARRLVKDHLTGLDDHVVRLAVDVADWSRGRAGTAPKRQRGGCGVVWRGLPRLGRGVVGKGVRQPSTRASRARAHASCGAVCASLAPPLTPERPWLVQTALRHVEDEREGVRVLAVDVPVEQRALRPTGRRPAV